MSMGCHRHYLRGTWAGSWTWTWILTLCWTEGCGSLTWTWSGNETATWPASSSGVSETWNESRSGIWICCSGNGCGNETGSCSWIGSVCDASGWGKSSGELLHAARLHRRHDENLEAAHSGPSALAVRARRARPHPWRPLHPRRPSCRGIAQRRSLCSPSCNDHEECTHLLHGHTFQTRDGGFRVRFGTSNCPLSGKSCPRHRAGAYRNSSC